MKKSVFLIIAILLLVISSLYAANGDLIVNGNLGIGTTSPEAKLDVHQPTQLGSTAGNYQLLSRLSGVAANYFMENTWLYRNSAGTYWETARIHNGISVDASFLIPKMDDKVWWERDPYNNVQSWGDTTNTYLTINNGNVGIGMTNPEARLDVHQPTQLGSTAGNYQLLSRLSGVAANYFMENTWLYRNSAGSYWETARIHNGISVDASFLIPRVDDRVWWERDPYNNVQSWGDTANTYLTINNGNVGIGTTFPGTKLSLYDSNENTAVPVLRINTGTGGVSNTGGAIEFFKGNGHSPMGRIYTANIFSAGAGDSKGKLILSSYYNAYQDELTLYNGSVGIGTTVPDSKLEVGTNTVFSGRLIRALGYSANDSDANIEIGDGGTVFWRLRRNNDNSFRTIMSSDWGITGGNVGIGTTDPSLGGKVGSKMTIVSGGSTGLALGYSTTLPSFALNPADDGSWTAYDYGSGTWAAGITQKGGNVGIGKTNPAYKLDVMGEINSNGYPVTSDIKFKKNFQQINDPLNKVLNLNGVSYEWKTDEYKDRGFQGGRHYGVIAQEIEKVLPEVVNAAPDGTKSVAYTEIIPVLIEAIKEQQQAIKEQQKRIEQLEKIIAGE